MKKLFLTLVVCFLTSNAHAGSVTFPQEPMPRLSKVVEVDGKQMILLPDGRVIPFGQSTICSDNCPVIEESPGRSRLWLLLIPAGIVAVIALWPDSPVVRVQQLSPGPNRETPPRGAEVPESATLGLLGFGLLGFSLLMRRKA